MTKILFFIPGLSEGGAEKVLCNLVNNMDRSRFDITVQTVYRYDSRKFLSEGIHYKYLFEKRSGYPGKIIDIWYRICTALRLTYLLYIKGDYDVEVAYLECGATKVMAASTNRKAAKIAWVHCDLSRKAGMAESASRVGKQYRKYDRIVCVSGDVEAGFRKLYGQDYPTAVLHNVLDEDEIFAKAELQNDWACDRTEPQLLAVGRLTRQKNFALLLDACGILRNRGLRFHLNILGEGPEHRNLEQKIRELDLGRNVTLQGFTTNPYPWMRGSDLIVCSSRYEGISTAVQEAMILGKPVVTTPCTGMRELLGDSRYGLIAVDSETGLADAVEVLLKDPVLLQLYSLLAAERGKAFRKKNVIDATEKMFEAVRKLEG